MDTGNKDPQRPHPAAHMDQDIYKVQRVCEILFIYFCAFIGFIFDRDSEEMTEGRVREREGKSCCKGPQVGLEPGSAAQPYSMWSPAQHTPSLCSSN